MTAKSRIELGVGIFIVIGLIILVSFVFFISDFQFIKPGYQFDVVFGFANGLREGAPSRFAGVDIGEVKALRVFYDPEALKTKARVRVWVKEDSRIPSDSQVWINTLGLLGEKYLEIIPGANYNALVKAGDTIIGQDPVAMAEITEETKKLILKIEQATGGLNDLLARIKSGQGTLGKLVYDETVYQNISAVSGDLKELTEDLKRHPWKLFFKPKEKRQKKSR